LPQAGQRTTGVSLTIQRYRGAPGNTIRLANANITVAIEQHHGLNDGGVFAFHRNILGKGEVEQGSRG
jgi:hypothetical protein